MFFLQSTHSFDITQENAGPWLSVFVGDAHDCTVSINNDKYDLRWTIAKFKKKTPSVKSEQNGRPLYVADRKFIGVGKTAV